MSLSFSEKGKVFGISDIFDKFRQFNLTKPLPLSAHVAVSRRNPMLVPKKSKHGRKKQKLKERRKQTHRASNARWLERHRAQQQAQQQPQTRQQAEQKAYLIRTIQKAGGVIPDLTIPLYQLEHQLQTLHAKNPKRKKN